MRVKQLLLAVSLLAVAISILIPLSQAQAQIRSIAGTSAARTPLDARRHKGMLDTLTNSALDPLLRGIFASQLISDSTTADFVINYIEKEPLPNIRMMAIRERSRNQYLHRSQNMRRLLERMAANDPDVRVATQAALELRSFAMADIQDKLNNLYNRTVASGDTSQAKMLPVLLDLQDDVILTQRGVSLPRFMRTPPPVFSAAPTDKPVRVLAFGDFGTGKETQAKVSAAIRAYHAKSPYALGITLGDNFYPQGLSTPDEPRWQKDYEAHYSQLGIRIYPAFGNHDWYDGDSPAAEISYTSRSKSWTMPAQYYTFVAGPVQFYAIDTNEMSEKQLIWLEQELAKSSAKWKIVYGHYPPYVASKNQDHDPRLLKVLWPILKKGNVDAYFAGHNHSMQQLKPTDGIAVFINGAAGQGLYEIDADDPRAIFLAQDYGFSVIDATDKTVTVRFVNYEGLELYAAELKK